MLISSDGRDWSTISSLLRRHAGYLSLLITLIIGIAAMSLSAPHLVARIIDSVSANPARVPIVGVELVGLYFGALVLGLAQNILQSSLAERVAMEVREGLVTYIANQDQDFLIEMRSEQIMTSMLLDVDTIKIFLAQAFGSLVSSVFVIVGTCFLLIWINWRLAILTLPVVPAVGLIFALLTKRVHGNFRRMQTAIEGLNGALTDNILGGPLIRILNSAVIEASRFARANNAAREAGEMVLNNFALMMPLITLVTNVVSVAILGIGGGLVISGTLTVGEFAEYNTFMALLLYPVTSFGLNSTWVGRAQAAYSRILQLQNAPPPTRWGTLADRLSGVIEVSKVSLTARDRRVLSNVSFRIEASSRTAIVGATGSGKSTLLLIVAGLLKPTEGSITYDGCPVTSYCRESFYSQIAVVFQESHHFKGSLRDNITLGAQIEAKALDKAVRTAELQPFIKRLPEGLDTLLAERGASLSGGQRQRITLARALAREPTVLLLDDFTARVDIATEVAVRRSLRANYPHMTTISVTQNLVSLSEYDQVLFLLNGEVMAAGAHDDLLCQNLDYAQLLFCQRPLNGGV